MDRLPDTLSEQGGVSEHADIRLSLEAIAVDGSLPDADRRVAWRALQEIRRLAALLRLDN